MIREPLVRYLDRTEAISCPHGSVRRVVTGGAGGIANVHVVRVQRGERHLHRAYAEVYYVLSGAGRIVLGAETHALRPGAVVSIPAGVPHELEASGDEPLEFVIFGTPPVPIDDERARPRRE